MERQPEGSEGAKRQRDGAGLTPAEGGAAECAGHRPRPRQLPRQRSAPPTAPRPFRPPFSER